MPAPKVARAFHERFAPRGLHKRLYGDPPRLFALAAGFSRVLRVRARGQRGAALVPACSGKPGTPHLHGLAWPSFAGHSRQVCRDAAGRRCRQGSPLVTANGRGWRQTGRVSMCPFGAAVGVGRACRGRGALSAGLGGSIGLRQRAGAACVPHACSAPHMSACHARAGLACLPTMLLPGALPGRCCHTARNTHPANSSACRDAVQQGRPPANHNLSAQLKETAAGPPSSTEFTAARQQSISN
jgi:hypothetical protein